MKYTLHLMHQSLDSDDNEVRLKDVRYALVDIVPDVISWTEAGGLKKDIRDLCREKDYVPVFFNNNPGEAFAFRPSVVKLKDAGNIRATTADNGHWINWISLKLDDETIWYHTAHWYGNLAEGEGAVIRHNQMTRQMAACVRRHSAGALSFFSGDINVDDNGPTLGSYNQIMRENDLLSIWDEFAVYPATLDQGGKTVDIIGSYDKDNRVAGKRYKLHPLQESDHRALSVWYEISRARVTTPNPDGTGPNPGDDDFFTAGGRDWSDYLRGDIYNLPQAVDDSGDPLHGGLISD